MNIYIGESVLTRFADDDANNGAHHIHAKVLAMKVSFGMNVYLVECPSRIGIATVPSTEMLSEADRPVGLYCTVWHSKSASDYSLDKCIHSLGFGNHMELVSL